MHIPSPLTQSLERAYEESRARPEATPARPTPFDPPQTARTQTGLSAYTGSWTRAEAAHLLRRCLFGPTRDQIDTATQLGLSATIQQLFAPQTAPNPPLNYDFALDLQVPVGATWVNADFTPNTNGYRRNSLVAWWVSLMLNQGISLREKMTLFWHNHFSTELEVYNDARYGYLHLDLLRRNALGNFKSLVEEVTIDPAMLRYLNGNENVVGRPNENYARELFELFTIGKGPLVAPGNYTTYTEDDVLAASRVLTGWRDQGHRFGTGPIRSEFVANRHDTTIKGFSAAFNNQRIVNNGDEEYKDLIAMIFGKSDTARFICRKLYRWFVYYEIDVAAEQNVIEPMAQMLIQQNFEIAPVLKALLESEHFFDSLNRGCVIKNPLDFTVGLARQLEMTFPNPAQDLFPAYRMWLDIYFASAVQQQAPLSPPSVAGWPAYYQQPSYYQTWINSATLPFRRDLGLYLLFVGLRYRGKSAIIDPLALVAQTSNASDPNVIVAEFAELLCPQPLEPSQLTYLKSSLLPGLPDFEWTVEYNLHLQNPTDRPLRESVTNKLRLLLYAILSLAEQQLA